MLKPKLNVLNLEYLEDAQMTVGIFSAMVALTTACIYFFATIRFRNDILPILNNLSLSFFILLIPQGYKVLAHRLHWQRETPSSWLTTDSSLSLIALLILILTGILVSFFNVNILPVFSIIGIVLAVISFYIFFKSSKPFITLRFLIISVLLSSWFATTVLNSTWRNLFAEEWLMIDSSQLPDIISDQFVHGNIANMIKIYGVPSTGFDALPPINYHFGSHWIFAQLSNLVNLSALRFYQLSFPIIMVPFLLKSILCFSLDIRQYYRLKSNVYCLRSDLIYWAVFSLAYITVIPNQISQEMIPWWHKLPQSLNSESYTLSIALSFVLFSLASYIFTKNIKNLPSKLDMIFIIAVFPFLVGLISFVKISTAFLVLTASLYLFVRMQLYKYKIFNIALGVMLLVFIIVYSVTSVHYSTNIKILGFVRDFVGKPWQPFFLLFHLFWSWIFIILKLNERKIKTLLDVKKAYLNRKILDIEFVFLLAFVGMVPGALLDIFSGSAFFFSDFQTWVALSFILANLPSFILTFRRFYQ